MQAIQFSQFGFANLQQVELPEPCAGPGEVLVRIHAAALNYRDRLIIEGSYLPDLALPASPLSDGAGEVVEVGHGVTRWKVGDRVTTHYSSTWIAGRAQARHAAGKLGGPQPGVLRKIIAIDQQALVATPAYLDDVQAATLPIAALTAWNALEQCGAGPGQTVLLQGTGGVSLFALQLARLRGARIIITSSDDAKLERARQLGAHDTINYRRTEQWSVAVRELTAGIGADVVLEMGGSHTLAQSLASVRHGGNIAVIGFLAGTGNGPDVARALVSTQARLQGISVGHRESFEAMLCAMTLARIKPVVDRCYGMEELAAAFSHMGSAENFGKVVIRL